MCFFEEKKLLRSTPLWFPSPMGHHGLSHPLRTQPWVSRSYPPNYSVSFHCIFWSFQPSFHQEILFKVATLGESSRLLRWVSGQHPYWPPLLYFCFISVVSLSHSYLCGHSGCNYFFQDFKCSLLWTTPLYKYHNHYIQADDIIMYVTADTIPYAQTFL